LRHEPARQSEGLGFTKQRDVSARAEPGSADDAPMSAMQQKIMTRQNIDRIH
jgi:hypothetical protein